MIHACIFDAFGTLFNLDQTLVNDIQHKSVDKILSYAREKQLAYTWLKSLMEDYINFEEITKIALEDACLKYDAPTKLIKDLSNIYFKPIVFDDVKSILALLQKLNIKTGILSNGTHAMLNSGIEINDFKNDIDVIYSADDIQTFKPHPSVYQMVCDGENCEPQDILFISSNQWDIAGANKFGFQTTWLNRSQSFRESIIRSEQVTELQTATEIYALLNQNLR